MKNKISSYLVIALFLCALAYGFFLRIGSWLAVADKPVKADVVVCLGGDRARTDKAVFLLQQNMAGKIVVTTDEVYREVLGRKVSPDKILKADWSAANTYQEGMIIKALLDRKYGSAMVVSDSFHLYRVRWTLHHFFHDDAIKFALISSDAPSLQGFWWDDMNSRLFVLTEMPKVLYYWLYHGLLGFADDPQWTVDLKKWYAQKLQEVMALQWVRVVWVGAV